MEKLIFVDKTELSFDAIYVSGSELVITVNNGDFAALETKFSDAANLEKLIQTDADGHKMAAFRNYAILKSITKRKNVIIDEIEETKADIIDVAIEKEPEWVVSQRYQDHRIKAAEDTVDMPYTCTQDYGDCTLLTFCHQKTATQNVTIKNLNGSYNIKQIVPAHIGGTLCFLAIVDVTSLNKGATIDTESSDTKRVFII